MPRKAIRIKADPPSPEVAKKYMRFWNQKVLYQAPEQYSPISSPTLFGDERPLELEVGSGTGEFLCSLAEQEPGTNFVGVDIWPKMVYRSVETAAEAGLDNILFIRAPFEFTYPLLVPNSLRAVYVHYPIPHIRSRGQHKIFNPAFLDAVHGALEPGGRLHVVSDHEELFAEMLGLVEQEPRWEKSHEARYLVGYEPEVKSRYQRLWERHEVPPLRFEVRKQPSSD